MLDKIEKLANWLDEHHFALRLMCLGGVVFSFIRKAPKYMIFWAMFVCLQIGNRLDDMYREITRSRY